MKKKKVFKALLAILVCFSLLSLVGCSGGKRKIADKNGNMLSYSPDDENLEDGYYIMHDNKYYPLLPEEIQEKPVVYQWFTEYDNLIPELNEGDSLVYVSSEAVPEEFKIYQMEDYGYTLGIRFTVDDPADKADTVSSGGRAKITISTNNSLDSGDAFCSLSKVEDYLKDASDTKDFKNIEFTEINGKDFSVTMLSDEGFLKNLTEDGIYPLSFYIGTKYYTADLKADTHLFVQKNEYLISSYSKMKSKHFALNIPASMANGYYNIDGKGMFKYNAANKIEMDNQISDGTPQAQPEPPQEETPSNTVAPALPAN